MRSILRHMYLFSIYISRYLEFVIAGFLFSMVILSLAQVLMRYCFKSPFTWSEELVRYLFVWSIFLGGSLAMAKNLHLKMGINIAAVLPDIVCRTINSIISMCIFSVLIILLWKGFEVVELTKDRYSTALQIPMWYVWSSVPINGAIMLYFFLLSKLAIYFPDIAVVGRSSMDRNGRKLTT